MSSVLTPSFAKNNHGGGLGGGPASDTPSGHSDFSFAIKDAGFSERSSSSRGGYTNFSEERKKNAKNLLSGKSNRKIILQKDLSNT